MNLPRVASLLILDQECINDSPGRKQKNPEKHLKNCRPDFPQLRSVFVIEEYKKRKKWPLWESSEVETRADLNNHKYFWENSLCTCETKSQAFWKTTLSVYQV